jgi:hypothetical protein
MYEGFFSSLKVRVRETDSEVIEAATSLRASIGLKTADAIHRATVILAGVAEF